MKPRGWTWTARGALELVRTTRHGRRHACRACGTVLTIVYDSQPDCLWPAAGVLDDGSLPADLGAALCRSIHICCLHKQPWYRLPEDGLDRLAPMLPDSGTGQATERQGRNDSGRKRHCS